MRDDQVKSNLTIFQAGALVVLIVVAIWSIGVLFLHLFEPMDIDKFEITLLFTIAFTCAALIPTFLASSKRGISCWDLFLCGYARWWSLCNH